MEPVALLLSLFANFERFAGEIKLSLKGRGSGTHLSNPANLAFRGEFSSLPDFIHLSLFFFASEKRRVQAADLI